MNAPRDPRFPPVSLEGQRQPWQLPQSLPAFPMSPPRPKGRSSTPGAGGISEVRNDHNYASVVDFPINVGTTSIIVLDVPTGLRNLLMFRNSSPAAEIIYIGFGREATTQATLAINPGQIVLFDIVVPQDILYAVASAATGVLSIAYSTIPEV